MELLFAGWRQMDTMGANPFRWRGYIPDTCTQSRFPVGFKQAAHLAFGAAAKVISEQSRLSGFDEARKRHRSSRVRQGIVSAPVVQPVGGGQSLQFVDGQPLIVDGPLDAFGPQGACSTHQVDEIPSGIAVPPLPGVGVHQVAIQPVTHEFVIEPQVVVTGHTGIRL